MWLHGRGKASGKQSGYAGKDLRLWIVGQHIGKLGT